METNAIQINHGGFLDISQSNMFDFGTGDFTLEAWVKTFKGGTIIGRKGTDGGTGNGGFLLVANPDGTVKFATDNGYGFFEAVSEKTSLTDGVWHHIAAVRQGAILSLYFDGRLLKVTMRGNAQPPLDVNNSLRVTIGTVDQQQEPYRFFSGIVSEVRMWNTARSYQDIVYWFSKKLPPDVYGLVGYWATDFGLTIDFSPYRQSTKTWGIVSDTTDGPPIFSNSEIASLFLFAGQYATSINSNGQWQNSENLYITSSGYVVYGNTRINGVQFGGNNLGWSMDKNPAKAVITFKLDSDSSRYWPQGNQTVPLFEGRMQSSESGVLDFRGLLQPRRRLCGAILSYASGRIIIAGNGMPGSNLTLGDKNPGQHEHFCIYDDNTILGMMTGAPIGIEGPIKAGSRLILKEKNSADPDIKWLFGSDGVTRSNANNNFAIAISKDDSQNLILADADPNDPSQKWLSLSLRQFAWNGIPNHVLTAEIGSTPGVYDKVVGAQKANSSPNQLWYFVRDAIFAEANAYALTVKGAAEIGAHLFLAKYQASDAQRFTANGNQIIHAPSGLIIKLDSDMNAVLADPSDTSDSTIWTISSLQERSSDINTYQMKNVVKRSLETSNFIDYVIEITTGSELGAGTDDKVEISLVGENQSTDLVELKKSETHSDPFERGQTDRFTVHLQNVGRIKGIFVRYGENTWFGGGEWGVHRITAYDPTTFNVYASNVMISMGTGASDLNIFGVFDAPTQYWMPYKSTISLSKISSGSDKYCTMSVGKAPSQDSITRGWVDHTWVVLKEKGGSLETYFDAAGGHGGPQAVDNILTTNCYFGQAILMATSYSLDSEHPYKPVYGNNDVTGQETCGVRASGIRNWDGQCHQIVNRLLYIGSPRHTLGDAIISRPDDPIDNRPAGYGLSVIAWGPYGVGFADWCRQIGVLPPEDTSSSIFDYIQHYLGNRNKSNKVLYHAQTLQDALKSDPENPQGANVKKFFKNIHNEGISNATIANMVNLTEDQVLLEEQG